MALEKGYYKAEGLDVTMDPGQGSAGAVQRVATGAYQIGFADVNMIGTMSRTRARKPCVFMAYDFPPFGVYALKKSGIKGPKDLTARSWRAGVRRLVPPVPGLRQEERHRQDRACQPDAAAARAEPGAGHGRLHLRPLFLVVLDLEARGVKLDDLVVMRYVDFGMDVYGNGIVVSPEMANNQKAVKGFLTATLKAWKDVVADHKLGIAAAKKRDPLIDEALETDACRCRWIPTS